MAQRHIITPENERKTVEPFFHKHLSRHNITYTKLPTLRTLVSAGKIDNRKSEINLVSFEKKLMLESQNMESPKGNKHPNIQEGVVNLIKPLYKKVLRKPICDEDLKELDDNEIMDNLVNFILYLFRIGFLFLSCPLIFFSHSFVFLCFFSQFFLFSFQFFL